MRHRMSPEKFRQLRQKNARNALGVRRALGRPLQHYVADILKTAMAAGAPIKAVKEARPFSPADRRGWDIGIVDPDGQLHSFEVKSSESGARKFKDRGLKHGWPEIPVIVPRLNDTPQQILDQIGEVMPFLRGFKLEKGEAK